MNQQEVFNKVVKHLAKQMCRSKISNMGPCAYRGQGGKMCAVGCLIPNKLYDSDIEGHVVGERCVNNILRKQNIRSFSMLRRLQRIHDLYNPKDWNKVLKELGEELKLDTTVVNRAFKN